MNANKSNSRKGFTLAEMLMAMTISSFILAGAYASIISLAKGSESLINYTEMNNQCRYALELFSRDMRMAADVLQHDFNKGSLVIERVQPDGSSIFIRYHYIDDSGTGGHFKREEWSVYPGNPSFDLLKDDVLMFDVEALELRYYRFNRDVVALNPLEVKHVEIEAELQRDVLGIVNTNYIVSARFMMRNKDVTSQ